MENYILLKDLPDSTKGTRVIWDEKKYCFYYENTPINQKNYLSESQVTQSPEWFCKEKEYVELYVFENAVYSRKEILDLLKDCFPEKKLTGIQTNGVYNISASQQIYNFEQELINLGKTKAELLMKEHKYTIEDLKKCFEESRLTHHIIGFKHQTFEEFLITI